MAEVTIKFKPYFKEPMLSGQKVCTARTSRKAAAGDTFQAFGATFQVMSVSKEHLYFVADLWYQEGCTSQNHFIDVWKEIHPGIGYRPKQLVYLHRFKQVLHG